MRTTSVLAVGLLGVLLVLLGPSAWGGWFPADFTRNGDVFHISLLYERWAGYLSHGHLPLWFPEFEGGHPLAAAWMYGLLYPGLGLFLVLPAPVAWSWTGLLHVVLGGVGMHLYLRERARCAEAAATGAVLFALSPFVVGHVFSGQLNMLLPVAWVPWILREVARTVRAEPRAPLRLALTAAMGLLSGHVQMWFYLGPAIVVVAAVTALGADPGRRAAAAGRLAVGAVLAAGLTAIQWLPALGLVRLAAPPGSAVSPLAALTSAPAHVLAALALPGAIGRPGSAPWTHEPFPQAFLAVGGLWTVALVFVALGRPRPLRVVWLALALVGIVLATGVHTTLGRALGSLPPFSYGRTPGRALVLLVVALPPLAAAGVHDWLEGDWSDRRSRVRAVVGAVGGACLVGAVAFLLVRSVATDASVRAAGDVMARVVWPAAGAALLGLGVGVAALVAAGDRPWTRWLPCAAAGLCACLLGLPPRQSLPAELYYRDWSSVLPEDVAAGRFHLQNNTFPTLERQGMRSMRDLCYVDTEGFDRLWADPTPAEAYWFDVRVVFEPAPLESPRMEVVETPGLGAGAVFPSARFGVASEEVARRLRSGQRALYVHGDPGEGEHDAAAPAIEIATVSRAPDADPLVARFEVETPAAGWFVASEKFHPGWQADVDGFPVSVHRANLALRAVRVPAGRHEITFRYRPTMFLWGAGVSALFLLDLLVLFALGKRRDRVSKDAA